MERDRPSRFAGADRSSYVIASLMLKYTENALYLILEGNKLYGTRTRNSERSHFSTDIR
jgi:hypothetical protein